MLFVLNLSLQRLYWNWAGFTHSFKVKNCSNYCDYH